eukprot:gene10934-13392_t
MKKEDEEEAFRRREERKRRRLEKLEKKRKKKGDGKPKLHRLKKLKSNTATNNSSSNDNSSNIKNINDDDDVFGDEMDGDHSTDAQNHDQEEELNDDFVVDSKYKHKKMSGIPDRIQHPSKYSDIFGDDDEEEEEGFQPEEPDIYGEDLEPEKVKDKLTLIREQYEPSLLEEKHFTDADEEIRQNNLPERFINRKGTTYSGDRQTLDEAEWIYDMSFDTKEDRDTKAIETIAHILKFIQRDMLEIPFIYTYEKDIYEPYFTLQDLWTIFDLDEKWAHIKASKKSLETISTTNSNLDQYQHILIESKTEENISDLYDLFQMINSQSSDTKSMSKSILDDDSNSNSNSKPKKAIKRDLYTIYSRAGLNRFLTNFGMTAQEFGVNLMDSYMSNTPKDHNEEPSSAALAFICLEADDCNRVLQATRYMMAQEIGYDPHVRQSVRIIYRRYAHISTTPTLKGSKEVDVFHPYFTVKTLHEKPVHSFDDTQYLLILKAEKEGFIKSTMAISDTIHETVIIPEMESLYLSSGTSSVSQQWNKQRQLIIRESLTKFLYPVLEKELRNKMLTESSNRVSFECAKKLEEKLRIAPWQPPQQSDEDEYDDDHHQRFKIFSICWGSDRVPTMGAVLDSEGELIGHAKLDFLCDKTGESVLKNKKQEDVDKLSALLIEHQPRLIVVSATELDSRRIYEEIKEQVSRLKNQGQLRKSVDITFGCPEIGQSMQNSTKYEEEFKEFPAILRHAIAVGRCILDPLTEYASLCTDSNEILYLKLHPLQDMIGKDYLVKLLHRCFINVVNAVGVDINRMIRHKYTASTLQFVSGLGSRKAQMLLNLIFRRDGYISSRQSLGKLLNQDIVYRNCIGFIQIRERYLGSKDNKINHLDDTRIHPESYQISYRIAAEALDKPPKEDFLQDYIEEVMKKPKKLDRLDFDDFSNSLESQQGKMKKLLYLIKKELTSPFADIRNFYSPPTTDDIFFWLTGETDSTLRQGTMVSATTFRNSPEGVRCRLDNGLEGTITADNLSDSNDTKTLPRGLTLNCRVLSIDKERFTVNLSCKPSDLDIRKWEDIIYHDLKKNGSNPYLVLGELPASSSKPSTEKRKVPVKKLVKKVKRVVIHPLWHSFTCLEAEKYLNDKPIGEAVLRPSSKGFDHITVTFKFWENIILHHDIKESDKPNAVSLGKSFYMGETKFDSLDEILARHVEYLINNLNDVRNHMYWKNGTQQEIDDKIRQEKQNNPSRIPYFFGIDYNHPGFITLYHVPSTNPRHEPILIKSEGFVMRKKTFSTLNDLIKYFKQNYSQILSSSNRTSNNNNNINSNNNNNNNNTNNNNNLNATPSNRQNDRFNNQNNQNNQNNRNYQPQQQMNNNFNQQQIPPQSTPYHQQNYQQQQPQMNNFNQQQQQPYQTPIQQQPYQTPMQNPYQTPRQQQQQQPYQTPSHYSSNYQQSPFDSRMNTPNAQRQQPPQNYPPQQQQQWNNQQQNYQPQQPQQQQWNNPQYPPQRPFNTGPHPPPQQQYMGQQQQQPQQQYPQQPWNDNRNQQQQQQQQQQQNNYGRPNPPQNQFQPYPPQQNNSQWD